MKNSGFQTLVWIVLFRCTTWLSRKFWWTCFKNDWYMKEKYFSVKNLELNASVYESHLFRCMLLLRLFVLTKIDNVCSLWLYPFYFCSCVLSMHDIKDTNYPLPSHTVHICSVSMSVEIYFILHKNTHTVVTYHSTGNKTLWVRNAHIWICTSGRR